MPSDYVFSCHLGMVRMQQVIDALIEKHYDAQVYMHRVKGVQNAYDTLIHIVSSSNDASENRRILLDMSFDNIEKLLHAQVVRQYITYSSLF